MGYYNLRVTGDALRMPYLVHEATYAMAPFFLWQHPRPEPTYRHEIIRNHHVNAVKYHMEQQSVWGLARVSKQKIRDLWTFYQGSHHTRLALTLPLFILPWVLRDRWPRFALLTCSLLIAGLLVGTWVQTHYAAPIIGLVCTAMLQAMRYMYLWRWRGRPTGRFLVWTLFVVAVTSFLLAFAERTQVKAFGWGSERARILAQLNADSKRHLVIVRYPSLDVPYDRGYREWVYNEADIDGAKVVWAREMDTSQNRRLLDYFKDRDVWLVEVDQYDSPPMMMPYPIETAFDVAVPSEVCGNTVF
jgi:hypothetical protein